MGYFQNADLPAKALVYSAFPSEGHELAIWMSKHSLTLIYDVKAHKNHFKSTEYLY